RRSRSRRCWCRRRSCCWPRRRRSASRCTASATTSSGAASRGGCDMMRPDRELRPLRAFTAGLGVETNTFSALHVGLEDFRRTFLYRPGEHPEALTEVSAPLHVLRRRRDRQHWQLHEGTYAFALPAG